MEGKNKNKDFGDYSSNLALIASKNLSEDPKKIAEILLGELVKQDFIHRINIAGPGFINFFLAPASRTEILKAINKEIEKEMRKLGIHQMDIAMGESRALSLDQIKKKFKIKTFF